MITFLHSERQTPTEKKIEYPVLYLFLMHFIHFRFILKKMAIPVSLNVPHVSETIEAALKNHIVPDQEFLLQGKFSL